MLLWCLFVLRIGLFVDRADGGRGIGVCYVQTSKYADCTDLFDALRLCPLLNTYSVVVTTSLFDYI